MVVVAAALSGNRSAGVFAKAACRLATRSGSGGSGPARCSSATEDDVGARGRRSALPPRCNGLQRVSMSDAARAMRLWTASRLPRDAVDPHRPTMENTMTISRACIVVVATALLALAPGATASATPGSGGCQTFGQSVAGLAASLGPQFGANASSVATRFGPRAFPEMVVHPEQDAACPE
jgi:hypothetical protein